jgi:hypothetical protein
MRELPLLQTKSTSCVEIEEQKGITVVGFEKLLGLAYSNIK